jgi:hypothetical protein
MSTYTKIVNGKRVCLPIREHISAKQYLRTILSECGFHLKLVIEDEVYYTKWCVLRVTWEYVSPSLYKTIVVATNPKNGDDLSICLSWSHPKSFCDDGNILLDLIREAWFS